MWGSELPRVHANVTTSYDSSSSVMEVYWANRSCDPFTSHTQPCLLGNYVSYAVNVSSPTDVVAAITFARRHNIRFVVRNTGHEYAFPPPGTPFRSWNWAY